jgi:hypothetical protein
MNNKSLFGGITDLLFLPIYIPLVLMYWFAYVIWNGFLLVLGVGLLYASCAVLLG